jgi:hypothetical protein
MKRHTSSDPLAELIVIGILLVGAVGWITIDHAISTKPGCQYQLVEGHQYPLYASKLYRSCKKDPISYFSNPILIGDQSQPVKVYLQTKTGFNRNPTRTYYMVSLPLVTGKSADQYSKDAIGSVIQVSGVNYSKVQDLGLTNVAATGSLAPNGTWYDIDMSYKQDPSI